MVLIEERAPSYAPARVNGALRHQFWLEPPVVSWVALCLAAGIVLTLLVQRLRSPWNITLNGWDGAFYSILARQRLEHGLFNLAQPAVYSAGSAQEGYFHHPPAVGFLVAASFAMFGEGELQARLVPLLASLGTLVLFYALVRGVASATTARLAVLAWLATPMFAVFGDLTSDVGPIEMFFLMATLVCLQRWLAGVSAALPLGAVCAGLAMTVDYPIAFLAVLLLVASPWTGSARRRLFVFSLLAGAAAAGVLFLHILFTAWQIGPGGLQDLIAAGLTRTGLSARTPTPLAWIRRLWTYEVLLISPAIMIGLSLAILLWRRSALRQTSLTRSLADTRRPGFWIAVLSLFGVVYVLVGNEGAYVHDYWGYVLLPGCALAVGVVLERVLTGAVPRRWLAWSSCLALPYLPLLGGVQPNLERTSLGLALAGVLAVGLLVVRRSRYLPALIVLALVLLNGTVAWKYARAQEYNQRDLALALASATEPTSIIVTTGNATPQLHYYSDRLIVPNAVELGQHLPKWSSLFDYQASGDLTGLQAFVRANQPVYLFNSPTGYYPQASVSAWIDQCVSGPVAPNLVYLERCPD